MKPPCLNGQGLLLFWHFNHFGLVEGQGGKEGAVFSLPLLNNMPSMMPPCHEKTRNKPYLDKLGSASKVQGVSFKAEDAPDTRCKRLVCGGRVSSSSSNSSSRRRSRSCRHSLPPRSLAPQTSKGGQRAWASREEELPSGFPKSAFVGFIAVRQTVRNSHFSP